MKPVIIVIAVAALAACADNGSAPAGSSAAPAAPKDEARAASDDKAPAVTPSRELKRREPLPELARDLLRTTMVSHGDNMENLQWATLMLDYESIVTLAGWIGTRPRFARAAPGQEDTLNAALPEGFFAFQDQLRESAQALARAAEARDDAAIADAYGRMTQTCIGCHSLYLRLPPQ
jgi:hypothetical protein